MFNKYKKLYIERGLKFTFGEVIEDYCDFFGNKLKVFTSKIKNVIYSARAIPIEKTNYHLFEKAPNLPWWISYSIVAFEILACNFFFLFSLCSLILCFCLAVFVLIKTVQLAWSLKFWFYCLLFFFFITKKEKIKKVFKKFKKGFDYNNDDLRNS